LIKKCPGGSGERNENRETPKMASGDYKCESGTIPGFPPPKVETMEILRK
jgi:hypothetical protein